MDQPGIQHQLTMQAGDSQLLSIRWSPDDQKIAAAASDGTVKIFTANGGLITSLPCYSDLPYSATGVRWRPASSKTKNILLAATCDGALYHYHVSSGKVIHFCKMDTGVLALDYSDDGNFYVVGCENATVQLFDENTKSTLRVFNEEAGVHHTSRVMCAKWTTPQCFWTGGWDKWVIMWDVRSRRSVKHLSNVKICGEAIDCLDNTLVTGEYEVHGQLKLWDVRNLSLQKEETLGEPGDKCLVYSVQVARDMIGVGGTGRNNLFFLGYPSVQLVGIVAGVEKPVYSVDFANLSKKVVVCSGDGSARVFSY